MKTDEWRVALCICLTRLVERGSLAELGGGQPRSEAPALDHTFTGSTSPEKEEQEERKEHQAPGKNRQHGSPHHAPPLPGRSRPSTTRKRFPLCRCMVQRTLVGKRTLR